MKQTLSIQSNKPYLVADAFRLCDPQMLLDVISGYEMDWSLPFKDSSDRDRRPFAKKAYETLNVIGMVAEHERINGRIPSEYDYFYADPTNEERFRRKEYEAEDVIVPWESFGIVGVNGIFERKICARIIHLKDLKTAQKHIDRTGGKVLTIEALYSGQINEAGYNLLDELVSTNFVSSIDSLIGMSWPEVLAKRIWLPDIYCERELYCVLANVFWAMTYFSFGGEEIDVPPIYQTYSDLYGIDEAFYADYEKRLDDFVDLLNYNSWVDSVREISKIVNDGN